MDIDTDTLTGILASVSTLATVGLSGVVAHFRRLLAPLRGRGEIRVVLLCRPQHREAVAAQREELLALGYRQVTLTHAAAAAAAADVVALWLPEPATAAATVDELRLAAPLSYILLYTQDRLAVNIDERSMLSNHTLRWLGDLDLVTGRWATRRR